MDLFGGDDAFNPNGGGGGFADFGFDGPTTATNGTTTAGNGSAPVPVEKAPGKVKITTVKLKKDGGAKQGGGGGGFGGGTDLMGGDGGGAANPFALPAPGAQPVVF